MWEPTQQQIEEIKAINGVQGAAQDEYYRIMLPIVFDEAKAYCNNTFGETDLLQPEIPGGVKQFMAKRIQFSQNKAGLRNRSMGTVSYSYESEFPKGFYDTLRPYKKVKFRAY